MYIYLYIYYIFFIYYIYIIYNIYIYIYIHNTYMKHQLISRTDHLITSGITSHGTDSFCVKPITPGHPIVLSFSGPWNEHSINY